jgi:hypothetical protein
MKCRSCGAEIADNALICYKCGTATSEPRIKPPAAARRSRGPMITTIVLGALALAAIIREFACGGLLQ